MGRLKVSERKSVPRPTLDKKAVTDAAEMILSCVREGMSTNWHIVRAQHPQWSEVKCETYFKAARSLAIRSMRSGI